MLLHFGKLGTLVLTLVLERVVTVFFRLRILLIHLRLLLVERAESLVLLQHLTHLREVIRFL